jgi:transposase
MLVTNHCEKEGGHFKVSAEEAITPYRDKVVIESSFRDIKSFVEVAPVDVWTEAHVKAHYTLCVLSHLINRTLTLRLHQNEGDMTKDIVTHEGLFEKLSPCQIDHIEVENVRLSTFNMTRSTSEQKELLDRLGLSHLLSHDVVKKARAS